MSRRRIRRNVDLLSALKRPTNPETSLLDRIGEDGIGLTVVHGSIGTEEVVEIVNPWTLHFQYHLENGSVKRYQTDTAVLLEMLEMLEDNVSTQDNTREVTDTQRQLRELQGHCNYLETQLANRVKDSNNGGKSHKRYMVASSLVIVGLSIMLALYIQSSHRLESEVKLLQSTAIETNE